MKQASIIPLVKLQAGALPFKVQTIKTFVEQQQDDISEAPHSHNYYEMIWLTRGRAALQVDMHEYEVDDNTIFCLKPNQAHQFPVHPDMEGFVFSFADSFFMMDDHDFGWATQASLSQIFNEGRTIKV